MRSVLLGLAAIVSFSAVADTFYVGPAGSNSNAGTSTAPWQTLQYAADTIAPGDTVTVMPGTYAGFNVTRGGSPGQRTVFSAQHFRLDASWAGAYVAGDATVGACASVSWIS